MDALESLVSCAKYVISKRLDWFGKLLEHSQGISRDKLLKMAKYERTIIIVNTINVWISVNIMMNRFNEGSQHRSTIKWKWLRTGDNHAYANFNRLRLKVCLTHGKIEIITIIKSYSDGNIKITESRRIQKIMNIKISQHRCHLKNYWKQRYTRKHRWWNPLIINYALTAK